MKMRDRFGNSAFTLIEMLVAVTVLILMMAMVFQIFNQASRIWLRGESRAETFQVARLAIESISREIEGAMVNTNFNAATSKRISFVTFEDQNNLNTVDASPPATTSVQATPPNDQIFFVSGASDSGVQSYSDLTEYGYFVVFVASNYQTMQSNQYCLVRHQCRSDSGSWNPFTANWQQTPGFSTASKTPLVDNVLRFELDYEKANTGLPQGSSIAADWSAFNDSNGAAVVLPRAVHITMSVLDRRFAARFAAVSATTPSVWPLSSASLADIPFNIASSSNLNAAQKNILKEGLRTFYRNVYLRNTNNY